MRSLRSKCMGNRLSFLRPPKKRFPRQVGSRIEFQGSAHNGYIEPPHVHRDYHQLCLFIQLSDLARAMSRRGNHRSAKFWRRVLLPDIERCRCRDILNYVRSDLGADSAIRCTATLGAVGVTISIE